MDAAWAEPPIDVSIDGKSIATNLDYGQAIGESLTAGSHQVTVNIEAPGGPQLLYGPVTLSFTAKTSYVVAVEEGNPEVSGSVFVDVFPQPSGTVEAQSARMQVLEAAYYGLFPTALLSVYVTAPGADLSTSAPFGTVTFQGATDSTEVPAGQYEIRVVQAGTLTPVLYDSGTLTLAGGSDLSLLVLQQIRDRTLIVLDSVDAAARNYWIYPSGTPVYLNMVNDAPGTPGELLVFANGVNLIGYGGFVWGYQLAGFAQISPGPTTLEIAGGNPTVSLNANLQEGQTYSLFAVGLSQLSAYLTQDEYRAYANFGRLRFIQGAPSAPAVDVYLGQPGPGVTPIFRSLTYLSNTGFVAIPPSEELVVTKAGTTTVLAELVNGPNQAPPTPQAGQIGTYVLADAFGGGPPFSIFIEQ
jgi:hypothetical protein